MCRLVKIAAIKPTTRLRPSSIATCKVSDRSKLPERVLCARQAISQRLQALSQDHFGTPEERNAIADALNGLAILEREIEGTKKRQA
jgi:hypothetical protein